MAETQSPIEALERALNEMDGVAAENFVVWAPDSLIADARKALAELEAVVEALRYYVAEEEGTEGDTEFLQDARAALVPFGESETE